MQQASKTMRIILHTFLLLIVVNGLTSTTLKPRRSTPSSNSSTTPSSTDAPLPEHMTVTLKMPRQIIELNLTKNLNTPSHVLVIVARNGTYSNWTQSNSDQFAAYYDVMSNASIVVEVKIENQKPKKLFRGLFSIDGAFYSIYPSDNNLYHDMNSTDDVIRVRIDGVEHIIMPENSTMDAYDVLNATKLKANPNAMFNEALFSDWPSGFQRYVVEVCFFIDYALFYRWYSRSQAYDYWGRFYDAVTNLQYYFVQVANGMDLRYSSIRQSDYSINIRLVGIYIAATPSDSFWTETSDVKMYYGPDTYVHMYKALTAFEKWITNQIPLMGVTFDQATVFTGYNMYDGYYCGGIPCSKSGLADIGSICQLSSPVATSASICKEAGLYAAINTAAHELGHNLGAQHDGTENNCNSADQYLMAISPIALTANNFNNPFTFSSCSMWYFRNTLASVTMKGQGNCLLVGSSAPTIIAPSNFPAFPGMQYSADQQCQNIYGYGSYYCAGGSRDQTICRSMLCWVPSKRICFATAEQRAADGTKCGNRKWCLNGQCVYDSRAAPAPDTCVYGDYKDLIDTGTGVTMSCYDIGRRQPYSCYDNRTNADCCQTCSSIRDTTKPASCGFGNKNPSFCQSRTKRYYCYESSFADACCDFCFKLKVNSPGCEYGDQADWCSSSSAYICYTSSGLCCETCQKYYTVTSGCEYGDKAPWCSTTSLSAEMCQAGTGATCCAGCSRYLSRQSNLPPLNCPNGDQASYCSSMSQSYCYTMESTCCSSCSRYRTGPAGCEYGDKADWCSSYVKGLAECQRPEVADSCCQRCAPYLTSSVLTDGASWCSTIFAGDCYVPSVVSTCQFTCSRNKRSNPNCMYGNRYTWCRVDYCNTNRNDCCEVCS